MITNKLKQLREKHNMTQEDLADRLGYSRSMIGKWETGAVIPTSGQLLDISNIFSIPLQFFEDKEQLIDKYNVEFRNENTTKRKLLISALTETIIYLAGCLTMGICLFFYPSVALVISFGILFGIAILGMMVIPHLLAKNTKARNDVKEMKLWAIKRYNKTNYKAIKNANNIDQEFNKLILK